ncbi:CELL DIVISION CONTROL PROTEIN 11 [Ceraceosorus bombacis]|uniref:CELL DIVISION CONTROL PROTEIN 11 n=1 Tax=Ceraceosorus bombacis TaxID=401625 RepID=A0A0P1BMI2_9BASI|nr:CELL DIVISION CONTROL PROTEIN 11 [Ceraceosorus bombacis]
MPLFRRRSIPKVSKAAPALPDLALPGLESVADLNAAYGMAAPASTDSDLAQSDRNPKTQQVLPASLPNSLAQTPAPRQTPQAEPHKSELSSDHPPSKTSAASMLGNSPSVPQYHRPWTREGVTDYASSSPLAAPNAGTPLVKSAISPTAQHRPPPSAYKPSRASPASEQDFRNSPNAVSQQSPQARRAAIEAGRRRSLRRSKAPTPLNILVAGAAGTGKTSWIRTLIASCEKEGSVQSLDPQLIGHGLSLNPTHRTRLHNPPIPLPTRAVINLPAFDLASDAILPLPAAPGSGVSRGSRGRRPTSIASTAAGLPTSRILVSITDTPGLDFAPAKEWETERKVRSLLREIESRLSRTLAEETKISRAPQSLADSHIDCVIYIIDPLSLSRSYGPKLDSVLARNGSAAGSVSADSKRDLEGGSYESAGYKRTKSISEGIAARDAILSGLRKSATVGRAAGQGQSLASMTNGSPDPAYGLSARQARSSGGLGSPFAEHKETFQNAGGDSDGIDEEATAERELALSPTELRAISRLAKHATIIPVIGKADLLTATALVEVREAVRSSLMRAGIGLGPFDIREESEDQDGALGPGQFRTNGHSHDSYEDEERDGTTNQSGEAAPSSRDAPVKRIRIRSRRTYSIAGQRTSIDSQSPGDERSEHGSPIELKQTPPIFDDLPTNAALGTLSAQQLASIIPFAIFGPESVPLQLPAALRREPNPESSASLMRRPSAGNLRKAPPPAALDEEFSLMTPLDSAIPRTQDVPPVPPLPTNLTGVASPGSNSTGSPFVRARENSSDLAISSTPGTAEQMGTSNGTGLSELGLLNLTDASARPATAGRSTMRPLTQTEMTKLARLKRDAEIGAIQRDTAPRFERSYFWGDASVLDPVHSDFSAMRYALLFTHLKTLKESSRALYEEHRARALEARRVTLSMPANEQRRLITSIGAL